ncbi:MAG: holo-ACP synthase [Gammaproteobacteria bacterium]|nr:holo-ACP synthase [Gammaproteobacteria bacterium]
MIFGIGTDIVNIPRIERSLKRFGDRFSRRILTQSEYEQYIHSSIPAHFLAKRFAAKEATAKALGTGFRHGLGLSHIGVVNDEYGKPGLRYYEQAAQLVEEKKIAVSHLSLSDDGDYAVAYVVLICADS